jgi:hypothetical protein
VSDPKDAPCPQCRGGGWICEIHPLQEAWHGGCEGAAMLCSCHVGEALKRELDARRKGRKNQ